MISKPYIDQRQAHTKNTPDWLITVRKGDISNTIRCGTEEQAQAQYAKLRKENS